MTPTRIPHDDEPDYGESTIEYRVTLPDGMTFTLTDPDTAEVYSRNGAEVNARKGWDA